MLHVLLADISCSQIIKASEITPQSFTLFHVAKPKLGNNNSCV